MKILITGISGTGKSTIASALNERGITAIDLHDIPGIFFWQDKTTKQTVEYTPVHSKEWFDTVDRICDLDKVKELFAQQGDVVMSGSTSGSNQKDFSRFLIKLSSCSPILKPLFIVCKPE